MRTWVSLCLLSALAVALPSQTTLAVGTTDVAWPNTTGAGNQTLLARVHYPAIAPGQNTAVQPNPSGWPVVVFLHGYSLLGQNYGALGDAWAQAGFVVVLSDTAQWNYIEQEHDGRALYGAILTANGVAGTLLTGAFDTQRIALAGHSMGGGSVGTVLANNPGYLCGLSLAPVAPAPAIAALMQVPFGVVVGTGDLITPWFLFGEPFYQTAGSTDGLKFLYLMNHECDHMNVAGLSTAPTPEVFERVADLGLGFLDHFMGLSISGLERVVGPTSLAEPRLVELAQEVAVPQVWVDGPLRIGRWTRMSVAAESGLGGLLAAFSMGPGITTPIGTLNLDPASVFTLASANVGDTQRFDVIHYVPNVPALVGLQVVLQAVGATPTQPLWLGSTLVLTVQS